MYISANLLYCMKHFEQNRLICINVMVHTMERNEEHGDKDVTQNYSL